MSRIQSDAHTSATVRGLSKSVSSTARRQFKKISFVQVSQGEHNREKNGRNGPFPKPASQLQIFVLLVT